MELTGLIFILDLAGWQLDKLAETAKKQVEDESDVDDSDEDIPFACLICRKPYTDPVVTRCGHYFCSACAIKRYAKTPKCTACGTPTGGIFNRADKVIDKINKKRTEKEAKEADDSGINDNDVQIQGLETAEAG
jgi:RING finger protein 113A